MLPLFVFGLLHERCAAQQNQGQDSENNGKNTNRGERPTDNDGSQSE